MEFEKNTESLCANEMVEPWCSINDELYKHAVITLSCSVIRIVISDFLFMANAVDLQECDSQEIEDLFSILENKYEANKWEYYDTLKQLKQPFSIKEFNKENRLNNMVDVFEKWVNENAENVLGSELFEALQERCDVASIVNKKQLGGGGFEVMRGLELDCVRLIAVIIKIACNYKPRCDNGSHS